MKAIAGRHQVICSKHYPRDFQQETIIQENGYPLYRRRDAGQSFIIQGKGTARGQQIIIDNRYVVSYNPYLTWRYKAHVNVEICGSIRAVKYIHKYIYKGGDQATVHLKSEKDEIKRYLNGRYIGPTEAIWRIFEFKVHEELRSVTHLAIHLPGEQAIYFPDGLNRQELQEQIENSKTTLTAFFSYHHQYSDGRELLYHEFPAHYRFISKQGWQKRVRAGTAAIGRIWSASPFMGEKYYLRLLLTVVRGPRGFEDLPTVGHECYNTFKEVCVALGLLENDGEWIATFTEGQNYASGYALRQLSTTALQYDTIIRPVDIWNQFKDSFCDDLPHYLASGLIMLPDNALEGMEDVHYDYGLYLIQQLLLEFNKSLSDFQLPLPVLH